MKNKKTFSEIMSEVVVRFTLTVCVLLIILFVFQTIIFPICIGSKFKTLGGKNNGLYKGI